MKQPKETIAFNCSLHQAHLLRRYARRIGLEELDIERLVNERAQRLGYVRLPPLSDLGQLQHSALAQQQAAGQQSCHGVLGGLAAGLRGLF